MTRSRNAASASTMSSIVWPGHRLGQEADEVAGMAGLEGHADFALRLEAADARAVAGARIDDDEWPLLVIDSDTLRRRDAGENVVHRARQLAPVHDEFGAELQNVRGGLGGVLLVLLAPLLHDVEEKDAALPSIDPIGPRLQRGISKLHQGKRRRLRLGRGFLIGHLTGHWKGPPRKQTRSGGVGRPETSFPPVEISRAKLAVAACAIRSRPFQRDADIPGMPSGKSTI